MSNFTCTVAGINNILKIIFRCIQPDGMLTKVVHHLRGSVVCPIVCPWQVKSIDVGDYHWW